MYDILYFLFIIMFVLVSFANMIAPKFMWRKTDFLKKVDEPSELYLVYRRIVCSLAFVAGLVYFVVPLLDRF